jgi:hypothetical protein
MVFLGIIGVKKVSASAISRWHDCVINFNYFLSQSMPYIDKGDRRSAFCPNSHKSFLRHFFFPNNFFLSEKKKLQDCALFASGDLA